MAESTKPLPFGVTLESTDPAAEKYNNLFNVLEYIKQACSQKAAEIEVPTLKSALYKYESGKPRRRLSLRFANPIVAVRYIENKETLKETYESSTFPPPQYDGQETPKSGSQPLLEINDRYANSTPGNIFQDKCLSFKRYNDESHKKEEANQKSQEQSCHSLRYNPYSNLERHGLKSRSLDGHRQTEDPCFANSSKYAVPEPKHEKKYDLSDTNENCGSNRHCEYEFSLIPPPSVSMQPLQNDTDQKSPINSNPVIHLRNHGDPVCKTEAGGVLIELISRAKHPPAKNLSICVFVETEFGYMKITPWNNPFSGASNSKTLSSCCHACRIQAEFYAKDEFNIIFAFVALACSYPKVFSNQDVYLGTEEITSIKYSSQTRKYENTKRITPYFVIENHKLFIKSHLVQEKQHPNAFGVYSTKEVLLKTLLCEETWESDDAGEICSLH